MNKYFRQGLFVLVIIMASIVPVPIQFFKKDILPSFKVENMKEIKEKDQECLDLFG